MIKQFTRTTKIGDLTVFEDSGFICEIIFFEKNIVKGQIFETELIKRTFVEIEEYFDGKRRNFDIPTNPKGTEFQKRVWEELKKIPYGKTESYGKIAKKIGNPKAQRAVGMANNKNPVPIIIPCHRVIGKNGSLTGYAYGLDVKKYLLNIENVKFL
ncbi:MAG: methylated-DNA--[protein]-cysteine S-methyltransferase [Candidatus Gastranaerophilaceae bacterium]